MTPIHTVASAPTSSPSDGRVSRCGSPGWPLLFAVVLFLAVAIVEAIIIAAAAPTLTDTTLFYSTTT